MHETTSNPSPKKFNLWNAVGLACCVIGLMWIVISLARNDNRIGIHVPIAMMWTCIGLAIVAIGRNQAKKTDATP
jgi:membrane protein DedA with SNARE-associated domain